MTIKERNSGTVPAVGLPTGDKPMNNQTMSPNRNVSDPHPSDEEHYDRQEHPGGANPPNGGDPRVAGNETSGKQDKKPDAAIDGPSP
jgi:hypothetical protein